MTKCVEFPRLRGGTSYPPILPCLMCCSQVKDLLVSEEFKPNCAMVVLDFLIRHAIIEPDSGLVSDHLVEFDSLSFMMRKTVTCVSSNFRALLSRICGWIAQITIKTDWWCATGQLAKDWYLFYLPLLLTPNIVSMCTRLLKTANINWRRDKIKTQEKLPYKNLFFQYISNESVEIQRCTGIQKIIDASKALFFLEWNAESLLRNYLHLIIWH